MHEKSKPSLLNYVTHQSDYTGTSVYITIVNASVLAVFKYSFTTKAAKDMIVDHIGRQAQIGSITLPVILHAWDSSRVVTVGA